MHKLTLFLYRVKLRIGLFLSTHSSVSYGGSVAYVGSSYCLFSCSKQLDCDRSARAPRPARPQSPYLPWWVWFFILLGCRRSSIIFWFLMKKICPWIFAELLCLWRKESPGNPPLPCCWCHVTPSIKYWYKLQCGWILKTLNKEKPASKNDILIPLPPRGPRKPLIYFLPVKMCLFRTFHTNGLIQCAVFSDPFL